MIYLYIVKFKYKQSKHLQMMQNNNHFTSPEKVGTNNIQNKIYQLMDYLNESDSDGQSQRECGQNPKSRIKELKSNEKSKKDFHRQKMEQMQMFAYQLEKEIIDLERSNKKSYLVTESGQEIEDQLREAEQCIKKSDKQLNSKYREYRDKILQAKITVKEKEQKFNNKAQMIEELLEIKLKKIVGRSEIVETSNRNRWNMMQQNVNKMETGSLDLIDTLQKLQRLKAQIYENQTEILDSQKKEKVEERIIEIQKKTSKDVQSELENLDTDFKKHYNTLQQIIQSISTKIT